MPLQLCLALFLLPAPQQSSAIPSAPTPSKQALDKSSVALVSNGSRRPPVLVYQVDAALTEEARKKHVSGNVEISLLVDESGAPQEVRVVRGFGMGLDEKAVEAVQQYRFKPATQNGTPVAMRIYVDVNFQIP